MKLVIIGAGNVATVLGRLFKKNGHRIIQVLSRNKENAQLLALELACDFTDMVSQLNLTADCYIVAIGDSELPVLSNTLQLGDKLIVHTAGSVSIKVLKDISANYGVIYPLQSLRKQHVNLQDNIPLLIDANSTKNMDILLDLAGSISRNISIADDQLRMKLHVAAVFVSNFTNHLYELTSLYCKKEGVDFNLLLPLIEETAVRLKYFSPKEMQTGPAARNDMGTIRSHEVLLDNYPELKTIYTSMTKSIMRLKDNEQA